MNKNREEVQMKEFMLEEEQMGAFDLEDELSTEKVKNTKRTMTKLGRLLLKQKFKILIVMSILVLKISLSLSTPLAISKVIDLVFEGVIRPLYSEVHEHHLDLYALGGIILLLVGKVVASKVLGYIQKHFVQDVTKGLIFSVKEETRCTLSNISSKRCNKAKREAIQNSISEDLERIEQGMQKGFIGVMTTAFTIIGAFMLMLKMNWVIAGISIVSILIALTFTMLIKLKCFKRFTNRKISTKYFQRFIMVEVGLISLLEGRLSLGQIQAFFQLTRRASKPMTETRPFQSLWTAFASARHTFCLLDEVEEVQN